MYRYLMVLLLLAMCGALPAQETKNLPDKLSPGLKKLSITGLRTDSTDVSLSAKQSWKPPPFARLLWQPFPGFFLVRLPLSGVHAVAADEAVVFISLTGTPKEEITTGASDPTLNQIPYARHRFPQINGASIATSVKERLFDTTDIDLQGRVFFSGLENPAITTHASLMATIMAGAGNSSPFALGAAPGALLSSSSFANLFPDPDSVFRRRGISLQNHSYGTLVENFYGNEAAAYDQSAVKNPALLHVFSAGNAGTTIATSGNYAGVAGMANLTGNFKQAKNILTVSGVDSTGGLLPLSSKGPAYDGRVKPELVAYGEDGSSGAAALTSGAAILVQDAYKRLQGFVPSSALTKAVLLNSADDVGEKQVDYISGFGNLNAFGALHTVNERRFMEDSVTHATLKRFSIVVPLNAAQLKLTLAWTDPPAVPNAAKALVNDLDLVVRSPSGTEWLPWVLNSLPDRASLLQPAERKKDTLNNAEQITIDDPAAGVYTVEVSSTGMVTTSQSFAVAYQIDTTNTFYWTWPSAPDQLMAGSRHTIRWQTNKAGNGRVEYATAGENWRPVGTTDSLGKKYLKWEVPDTMATARLRLISGPAVFVSDTFTISRQPTLKTGFNCTDSFLLYWPSLHAERYRLYALGNKYLEPFATTTDTALILFKQNAPSFYYSLAPLINGKEGIRSYTVNYTAQAVGCYLRSFYLQSQTGAAGLFVAEIGTVYNVAALGLEVLNGTAFVPVQTITSPQTTAFSFANVPLHPGENRFRLVIRLANGMLLYSDIETVYNVSEAVPVFVYPNPVAQSGTLKILTRDVGRYTVLFFDAAGRVLYRAELNNSVTALPVSRFPKGLYFVRILDREGGSQMLKQIIQ